jgi:hypothetical protein
VEKDPLEQTMLESAQESAQESYDELTEVLVENGLMTVDKTTFNHELTIGFTPEKWGSDCPDPFTQAAVIDKFFEELTLLTTADTLRIIAAYLKHANATDYVKSLEEDDDDA